jgi:acetyl esterase/lipase
MGSPVSLYRITQALVGLGLFSLASLANSFESAQSIKFPKVSANVAYAKVAGLKFSAADQKIAYGEDPLQFGLYWQARSNSAHPKVDRPTIVLIHGGCWLNAYDIKHTYPLATALAQEGYNVWSLEYRRTGDVGGGWPGTFDDIKAGVAHLKKLKIEGLSTKNILLAGHSAGGHLALLAAAELKQNPIKGINLKASIGLAAISDFVQYSQGNNSCQSATKGFMQGTLSEKPEAYAKANPIHYDLPVNTWLLHGDADAIVPIEQANLAKTNNKLIEKAGHFDWIHPGSEAYQVLLSTLEKVK